VSDLREAIFLLLLRLAGEIAQEAGEGVRHTVSPSFFPALALFFLLAPLVLAVAAVVIWVIQEGR
jgi:hypothetical protein